MANIFPEYLYLKVFDTDENVRICSFSVPSDTRLEYVRGRFWLNGEVSGNLARIRVNLYSDSQYSALKASSEWVKLKDFLTYSVVNFRFSGQNLAVGGMYYLEYETENYIRDGETTFLGALFDYPIETYENNVGMIANKGLNFAVIGEEI